ncbi:MAG: hypothetical protein GY832_11310 [Chloroflexi bacterium]|nr:hypothetical protein [Chloroflexota bacterium]
MSKIMQKIEPQPNLPIVSFFHGGDEYEDCDEWVYQSPETDDESGLTFNALHKFNDPNQPGKVGDLYDGFRIAHVGVQMSCDDAAYYWIITIADDVEQKESPNDR